MSSLGAISQEISGHYNVICQRSQRYPCGSHVESFLLKKGNHFAFSNHGITSWPSVAIRPGSTSLLTYRNGWPSMAFTQ